MSARAPLVAARVLRRDRAAGRLERGGAAGGARASAPPTPRSRARVDGALAARSGARSCAAARGAGRAPTWTAGGTATTSSRSCRIGARDDAAARPRCAALPLRPAPAALARCAAQHARRARAAHIAAHYDLGNDLFELFLDETMTYSCARLRAARRDAARGAGAQARRICRKLELGPDDHVLEIGTGWGGFAMHAAGRYGCRVTTTTISREQHDAARRAGARRRARGPGRGAAARTTATCSGRYDKLVSIEMIEAVGWQYFDTFFRRCADLLAPDGAMLLQAITIDDARLRGREGRAQLRQHATSSPAGACRRCEVIARCARRADRHDGRAGGHHGALPETLRRWREHFLAAPERVAELGYDERFRRLWELYLAYCEGGFRERRITGLPAAAAQATAPDGYLAALG